MSSDSSTALKLRVEGMDCGACGIKIENGLKRLPGVRDINVNVGLEMLSLVLDEDRTSRAALEQRIRSLGYTPHAVDGATAEAAAASTPRPEIEQQAWWQTRKGRFASATGALLVIAFAVAWFAPDFAFWAYSAAAIAGVLPILRRAGAGVRYGTPSRLEQVKI